ncbi:hypothetical protein J6590_032877 [Homalodisca vitripennis]|nr:hypothetical protein J6590_032877 [Homalodisca vitripennis]
MCKDARCPAPSGDATIHMVAILRFSTSSKYPYSSMNKTFVGLAKTGVPRSWISRLNQETRREVHDHRRDVLVSILALQDSRGQIVTAKKAVVVEHCVQTSAALGYLIHSVLQRAAAVLVNDLHTRPDRR